MNPQIHAEIMYNREDGINVHSDVCPPSCNPEGLKDQNWREYLHVVLDEWLNKSNGTGIFWIGDSNFLKEY